jgi:hypothetical protein
VNLIYKAGLWIMLRPVHALAFIAAATAAAVVFTVPDGGPNPDDDTTDIQPVKS